MTTKLSIDHDDDGSLSSMVTAKSTNSSLRTIPKKKRKSSKRRVGTDNDSMVTAKTHFSSPLSPIQQDSPNNNTTLIATKLKRPTTATMPGSIAKLSSFIKNLEDESLFIDDDLVGRLIHRRTLEMYEWIASSLDTGMEDPCEHSKTELLAMAGLSKIFLLLTQPSSKRFELIQVIANVEKSTIADILNVIPQNAIEDDLGNQKYVGLCRPMVGIEMISSLTSCGKGGCNIVAGEVLVAIPVNYSGMQCRKMSKSILNNAKLLKILRKVDPLSKSIRKKKSRRQKRSSLDTAELNENRPPSPSQVDYLKNQLSSLSVNNNNQSSTPETFKKAFSMFTELFNTEESNDKQSGSDEMERTLNDCLQVTGLNSQLNDDMSALYTISGFLSLLIVRHLFKVDSSSSVGASGMIMCLALFKTLTTYQKEHGEFGVSSHETPSKDSLQRMLEEIGLDAEKTV